MSAPEPAPDTLLKATPLEYQASLLGACVLFLGVGALIASYLDGFREVLIIAGALAHGWGMYRIRRRSR
jgi:hypothetical protein